MSRKGIFAFFANPITNGHIRLIGRAAALFDELHVVIVDNSKKESLFSLEQREVMVKSVLVASEFPNVIVVGWTRLLYLYADLHGIQHVVRGIRGEQDCVWEFQLENTYKSYHIQLDFIYLHAEPAYQHISSSWVTAMVQERASIHQMVPWLIKREVEKKILGQLTIGVTGSIGVGKSTVIRKLMQQIERQGGQAHHIDCDRIVHGIYDTGHMGPYQSQIKKVIALLPEFCVEKETSVVNRDQLRTFLRKIGINRAKKCLEDIVSILQTPIENEIQIQICHKKGIIFIESAILLEQESTHVCNGDVILVHADKSTLLERLDSEDLLHLLSGTTEEKQQKYHELPLNQRGYLWEVDTSHDTTLSVEEQLDQVATHLQEIFAS